MADSLRPLAAALALLLGCAGATRQSPPRSQRPGAGAVGGVVTLRFRWPEGFRARVELRHETNRTNGPSTRALVRQLLVAEQRGKEIWVFTRDSQAEGDEPDLELNLSIGEALVYVIGADGTFLRAEGLDRAVEILQSREERADPKTTPQSMRQSLARLAAEDWDLTAGAWRGQTFEEGNPRRHRVEGSLPLAPGIAASLDVEYVLEGRTPCDQGREPRCVQLRYASSPSADQKRSLLEQMRLGLDADEGTLEDVSARSEATLVTDPDTLVPYRLEVRQLLRLRFRPPGGAVREFEESSRDEYLFTAELEI